MSLITNQWQPLIEIAAATSHSWHHGCDTAFRLRHIMKFDEKFDEKRMEEILISSWKCNYSIYLDIQVHYLDIQAISTLLCLLLVLDVQLLIFIEYMLYKTALLKSDVFWHAKAYSSSPPEYWTYKDRTRFILKRNVVKYQKLSLNNLFSSKFIF